MSDATVVQSQEVVTVTEASTPSTHNNVLEAQGLTEVSEADLMGSEPETPELTTAPSEPLVETPPKEIIADEPKVEDEPVVEPTKTPKGFVPLEAIHEVRGENKYLKQRISELSALLSSKPVESPVEPVEPEDTFEELSDDEFLALSDTSPKDALLYMKQLSQVNEQKRQAEITFSQQQSLYNAVSAEMEQYVPGLFNSEDPTVADEFRDFATSIGFTDELFYLTNPSTQVMLPGQKNPALLGDAAAKIVKVLATVKKSLSESNAGKSAPVDLVAIKAEMYKEVEAEIMAKVKTGQPFRSLSTMPTSEETRPEFSSAVLTEAQFMKLTSKEQDLYLAGQ